MVEYILTGVEKPLALPDEYLTVSQWERCLRAMLKNGKVELDMGDLGTLRTMCQEVSGGTVDLESVPASPDNMKILMDMYAHLANLLAKSMQIGDEVVASAEKKDEGTSVPQKKKHSRSKTK